MQQVDDPPYLSVGTEVSAKYKGAFCEAKVRKVVRNIKCKVAYKQGLGTGTVSDDQIKYDVLRVGATVEVKHPERRDYIEATITKIQDCSQYTVVFDDGDITTLRRSALCLKSGRHFNESETLDQLPLTHPEHFGNPVIGGRRGRSLELYKKNLVRSRHTPDDSSDEDEEVETKPRLIEKEEHIGKIVCVESTDTKKKGPKENWFPALVVAPTAQDTVRIRVKDEYLVRSFKDGRYYTVPKKEATEFTREQASKQDTPAVQAALEFMHNDCLPAHWDRDVLFGLGNSLSDFYNEFDSDTSDDEPTEEKDHFVAQLYKYMDDRGTPLNKGPSIINKDVDLYRLYRAVQKLGGYNRVTTQNQWKQIAIRLGFVPTTTSIQNLVKQAYKKFLLPFEEFDRKLGCTMVAHPRANRIKGRSLVRASSVASPKPDKESKSTTSAAEESENTSESGVDTAKPRTKSKVKSLIDQYEEKFDDTKNEQKDIKEKESSLSKDLTNKLRDKEALPSNSGKNLEIPATISSRKDKTTKKQIPLPVDDRRGRKKIISKDTDVEKMKSEPFDKDKVDAVDVPINIGDKLRVYYHEQKVTYEAKVIEISKQGESQLYLVHYTGWNTRYDEWVPKERIAENLTNNKSNKRSKNGGKTETRSYSSLTEKISGPSPMIRTSSKRNRVGSKNDVDQHPRSTTPSSIASNSSRTKSPATSARRTTRGQPNKLRRTSNNTDISSMQTDSDSDSDEPVVKKPTPKRKSATAKSKSRRSNQIETIDEIKKEKYSNASSEEEPLANTLAKSKEMQLNQISNELKGFNEMKKNSTDTPISSQIQKMDYIPKSEPKTPPHSSQQASDTKKINSKNRNTFKTENSSDSDTSNENSNIMDSKKECDMKTDRSIDGEFIEKLATLKQSGIEKIIKNTLAEKPKGLSEKPSMKTLMDRTPLKHIDDDVQINTIDRNSEISTSPIKRNRSVDTETIENKNALTKDQEEQNIVKLEPNDRATTESVVHEINCVESNNETINAKNSSSLIAYTSNTDIDVDAMIKTERIDASFTKTEKPMTSNKVAKPMSIPTKDDSIDEESGECDVYEFKEPEPFEFEATKKTSPESDKKPKRKGVIDKPEIAKRSSTPPMKRPKKMIIKETEKSQQLKSSDDEPSSTSAHKPDTEEVVSGTSNIETEHQLSDTPKNRRDDNSKKLINSDLINEKTSDSTSIRDEPSESTSEVKREPQPDVKSLFINSFVEAPMEDQSKIFEINIENNSKGKSNSDDGLKSVKIIMLADEVLNQELPKIDKPSSIAEKVLKKINSQQQHSIPIDSSETIGTESEQIEIESNQSKEQSHKKISSPFPSQSSATTTRIDTISPVTSDEHISKPSRVTLIRPSENENSSTIKSAKAKIDILESISPKNNDLSETIQKLESVIQKAGDQSHMSDDSTDSTDSEQRLVIEDESQSLETCSETASIQTESDGAKEVKPVIKDLKPIFTTPKTSAMDTLVSNTLDQASNHINASEIHEHESVIESSIDAVKSVTEDDGVAEIKKQNKSDNITENIVVDVKTEEEIEPQNDESEVVQNESLSLLLCEETIPGSPAPVCPKEQCESVKKSYDNLFTNPHAVETDIKPMGSQSKHDQKIGENTATPASSPHDSMSQDESSEDVTKKQEQDRTVSPKKRRCTRKQSELESLAKRRKPVVRRNTITGSDSDDNSDINASQRLQRPSKTCQYNFLVQLDPAMNSNQRIALLKKKIQDLRKTYNMIKTELASIDRRRKKLRRREREMKKNAQQSHQSQQADQQSSINHHVQIAPQNPQNDSRMS